MTHYIGNLPIVGKRKTVAFRCHCEKCQRDSCFYWVKPYKSTIISNVIRRLLCLQRGLTIKGMQYSFHTLMVLLKLKKAVEIGKCEYCNLKKVRCRYCGNIENFENWQEVYICPKCHKKSYMIADHPQPVPWYMFEVILWDDDDDGDSEE